MRLIAGEAGQMFTHMTTDNGEARKLFFPNKDRGLVASHSEPEDLMIKVGIEFFQGAHVAARDLSAVFIEDLVCVWTIRHSV